MTRSPDDPILRVFSPRRGGVITLLGVHFEPGATHAHLDIAIRTGGRGAGGVADRVLVARVRRYAAVGLLQRRLRELVEHLAAGGRRVLGQDVAIADAGQANPLRLAV